MFKVLKYILELSKCCITQHLEWIKLQLRNSKLIIQFALLVFLLHFFQSESKAQTPKGFQWIKHHGDEITSNLERVIDIQTDQFGNIYVAGEVNEIFVRDSNDNIIPSIRYAPFDSLYNNGGRDIWLAKYNAQGDLLWYRYAGSGHNSDAYYDLKVDANGNSYISGEIFDHNNRPPQTFGNIPLDKDQVGSFIAKVSTNGQLLWHKNFGGDTIVQAGGAYLPYFAKPYEIQITNSEIICLFKGGGEGGVWGYQRLFDIDSLNNGIHVARFDLSGNYRGVNSFPFPRYDRLPQITSVNYNNNRYFISGNLNRDTVFVGNDTILEVGVNNAFVFAFDSTLIHLSSFYSTNHFDQFWDAKLLGDTIVTAGLFDLFINSTVTYDTITYTGGSNEGQAVGVFMFDATTNRLLGLYPSKATGHLPSATSGAAYLDHLSFGIGGTFEHSMSFSTSATPIVAVDHCSGCTNRDLFFALFDRSGGLITQEVIYSSGGSNDRVLAMHRQDSMLYIGGYIGDTAIVPGVDTFLTRGTADAFLAAYNLGILTSVSEQDGYIKADNGLLAYPNPSKGIVNIIGQPIDTKADLYNIKGQLIRSYRLDQKTFNQTIDLQGLDAGVYFLMVIGEGGKQSLKLVKQ